RNTVAPNQLVAVSVSIPEQLQPRFFPTTMSSRLSVRGPTPQETDYTGGPTEPLLFRLSWSVGSAQIRSPLRSVSGTLYLKVTANDGQIAHAQKYITVRTG